MKKTCGDIVGIPRNRGKTLKQLFDFSRVEKLHELKFCSFGAQARHDPGPLAGGDHIPHFSFGFGTVSQTFAALFIGVDLQTQPFPCIDQFHKQREPFCIGGFVPHKGPSVMFEKNRQRHPGKRPFGNNSFASFTVRNFPRFADPDIRRDLTVEQFAHQSSAPDAFLISGNEFQRGESTCFRELAHVTPPRCTSGRFPQTQDQDGRSGNFCPRSPGQHILQPAGRRPAGPG